MPIAAPNARDWGRRSQQSLVVIAIVLVIGSLHLAKSAVVPILLAVFLAMLLAPAVALVRRLGAPRAMAAGIVVVSLLADRLPAHNRSLQSQRLTPIETPPRIAAHGSEVSSATAQWLYTRKRKDKKAWHFSLPQETLTYR